MQSLENQVKEALIKKKAEESYKLMQKPEYQGMMRDMFKNNDEFSIRR